MNKVVYLFLLFIPFTVLTACSTGNDSPLGTKTAQPSLENAHQWRVELNVSGGFAGIERQLLINSTGAVIVSDRKLGRHEGNLSVEQLNELSNLLKALQSAPSQPKVSARPSRCADCVQSRISADIDGKQYNAMFHSGETAPQPYTDLLAYLTAILQRMLSNG